MAKSARTRTASRNATPGRQPGQKKIIKLLDEIGGLKGYASSLQRKAKGTIEDEESAIEFRPDLIMKPGIGWRVPEKVVEVEARVNNFTVSKSVLSVLDYISKHDGAKGFLIVHAKDARDATGMVNSIKATIRRFQGNGKGARRRIPVTVLSFDQVTKYHTKIQAYDQGGRIGPPPKFKGFDD